MTSIFVKNCAALRPWTPELADLLVATTIPPDFRPTLGTDASPTFAHVLTSPTGQKAIQWLGNTSMPKTSAEPLTSSLDPGQTNGLALSIGTAYEWLAFLPRLKPAQALYVYEPDPALLRMALDIADLSATLASGKFVLLTGPVDAAAFNLIQFLNKNPGFDPPNVLHPLPSIAPDQRNALLCAGEAIVRRAVQDRQSTLNSLNSQISTIGSFDGPPLAFTLTPRYPGECPIQHQNLQKIVIDRHDSSSLALRLALLLRHRPSKILSDLFRAQLACLPPRIPVETWIPPLIGPAFWDHLPPPTSLQPLDRIIIHAGVHQSYLQSRGFPSSQIELRPLGPPAALQSAPLPNTTHSVLSPQASSPSRIALFADLPRNDPDSLGITLPTHQAVYAAARELIAQDYLAIHFNSAPDLLRRALSRAGVSHDTPDPALKEPMLRMIRDILIPTIPLYTLTRTLLDQGLPALLLGDWPNFEPRSSDSSLLSTQTLFALHFPNFDSVALFLHLSPHGNPPPILWHIIAAQVPIVAPIHPSDTQPGSLPILLKPDTDFAHPRPQSLLSILKSLLRDSPRRTAIAQSALRRLH